MTKYTITLSNGASIEDLTMNGTMFVSKTEIIPGIFTPTALQLVHITKTDDDGSTTVTTMRNAVCDGVLHWPEGWLFNLREQTENEMLAECIMEMSEIIYG